MPSLINPSVSLQWLRDNLFVSLRPPPSASTVYKKVTDDLASELTLSDFRTYIYVQNPKTVATPVRKYTYPDGNQNMGASNGHFTVSGPLHHELCT